MDNAASRPGQEGRDHKSDALARSGRGEAQHVLRSIVPKVMSLETAEYHTVRTCEAGSADLKPARPAGRTIGRRRLRFPGPPHRHCECDHDRDDPARRGNACPFNEHCRRVGVKSVPPPEERRRKIDRDPRREFEPGSAELRLIAQPPCRPLRGGPHRDQHNRTDNGNLAPEYFCCGHGSGRSDDSAPTHNPFRMVRALPAIPANKSADHL
jgi:hypothetical protein